MADKDPLDDMAAYDRLHAAMLALGSEKGATVRADTALQAARRALGMLQLALLTASDNAATKAPDDP